MPKSPGTTIRLAGMVSLGLTIAAICLSSSSSADEWSRGGPSTPTDVQGIFLIRALPQLDPSEYFESIEDDEVVFLMQVRPEPKAKLLQIRSIKIDKAIDDRGQELVPSYANKREIYRGKEAKKAAEPGKKGSEPEQPGPAILLNGDGPFPVVFKRGKATSKSIAQLSGTITVAVRGAPEDLVEIDDVLRAEPRVIHGKAGCTMKLKSVTRNEDGSYHVDSEVTYPRTVEPYLLPPTPGEQAAYLKAIEELRKKRGPKEGDTPLEKLPPRNNYGLEVRDASGIALACEGIERGMWYIPNWFPPEKKYTELAMQSLMLFRAHDKRQGNPVTLVFKGAAPLEVQIPFSLKAISLPTRPDRREMKNPADIKK